jgi:hypothetical protein
MPRNSSGTYSLYTPGNPVVTGTVISSTWGNNTLADIASALTDSLSRTGDGGMQAPLELDDGAVGAPALTWATETTSGWYRAAAGDFRFSVSAADVLRVRSGTVGITGTATNNALSVTSPNTAGSSFGIAVAAGTNASDYAMLVQTALGGDLLRVYGTGGVLLSSATGGQQGLGTINATGVYDDGVLLANQAGANPSASVGTSAINGSAGTFMRSDAAPALNLAITPTWTGAHTWSGTSGQVSTLTASSTTAFIAHYLVNDASNAFRFALAGSANATAFITNGPTGPSGYVYTTSTSMPISFGTNGIERLRITDTQVQLANGEAVGYLRVPRSTTTTTLVLADSGKCVAVSAAIAIPASVFSAGDCVSVYNDSGSSVNITIAAGTLRLGGTTSTGTRALAPRGLATLWFNVGGATPEVIATGAGVS